MAALPSSLLVDPEIPPRVYARCQAHADFDPISGCLVSRYSVGSHGYAQIGWNDRGDRTMTLAHRAAWIYTFGPIASGMTVDHICKNRKCVNVAHMRLLTNHENARRTAGRDWPIGQCAHGHPNDRLRTKRGGKRVCVDCETRWRADYAAKALEVPQ